MFFQFSSNEPHTTPEDYARFEEHGLTPPQPVSGLLMGFDYGKKRIGVAVGQALTRTATPLPMIAAREGVPDWPAMGQLIKKWQPKAFVIGVPLNDDRSFNDMAKAACRFGRQLHGRFGLKVFGVNEFGSSIEAETSLVKAKQHNFHKKTAVDSMAAKFILERWLTEPWQNEACDN